MKTAIIVAGVLRFTEIAFPSWNFPVVGDYFLSAWDLSHHAFNPDLFSSEKEISFLRSTGRFNEIFISDYIEFLKQYDGHHSSRILFLYKTAYDKLKNLGYDRVILFRPDLFLFDNGAIMRDFDLSDNMALNLGMHEPGHWIQPEKKYVEDQLFCMNWNLFEKLVSMFQFSARLKSRISVHSILFDFFDRNKIQLQPLNNYRCVIIREGAVNEIKNGRIADYDFLLNEFMKLYTENKSTIKFYRKLHLSKYY